LNDPTDDDLRTEAVRAIHALGPAATDAIPALVAALESLEPAHRRGEVLPVLGEFGAALVPHLPRLAELSRRPEFAEMRGSFATLFAKLAPHEPAAREPLRELLRAAAPNDAPDWNARATNKSTRQTCAAALLSFNDASLLPDLAPLLADPEADIRRDVVHRFDKLDAPAVLPLIRQALADTEESVRRRAIEVLARRADTSGETVDALVHALEDRAPKVRRAAADALGQLKIGTDAVLAALAAATEDADTKVAERAAIALKKVTPKGARAKKAPAPTKGKKKRE
jgi:HEAT repeat protein